VQGTHGAEFAPELKQELIQAIIRKGSDPNVDSYSAFTDNAGMNPTGLDGYLRARGVKRIYIVGLALDYCVLWSALDARRLLPEAEVCVVLDATRHVDSGTGADAVGEMEGAGVRMVRSREITGAGRPARE
jgi:nicotinamidase/pyrazinamidase